MAGYTSTARQYGEYLQPFNIDMIAKGLSYKENRYESADASIRAKINQIGSIDIIKDADKGYLLSRLTSMVGDVNEVGQLDLSDAGVVKNLDNHISQSIDDKVLSAFQSTKQIRAFQQNLDEIQKKNPDIYNTKNVAYAMQPVSRYMQSDKVGESISDYGALIYTPYTDVAGEVTKEMDSYIKNMKDGIIKVQGRTVKNANGQDVYDPTAIWEVDTNGMNQQQVKDLIGSTISSKYSEQAKIDSWVRYGQYNAQGKNIFDRDVDNFIKSKSNEYDSKILQVEADINTVKDKGQDVSSLSTMVNNLKLEKNSLNSLRSNMLNNPEAYGGYLEREGLMNNLTTKYFPLLKATPDSYVGKNEVYYENQELQYKQMKYDMDLETLDLARQKNNREQLEFELKASGKWKPGGTSNSSDGSDTSNNSKSTNNGLSIGTLPTDTQQNRNFEQETVDIIGEKDKTVQDMTKNTYDYVQRMASSGDKNASNLLKQYDSKRGGKHNGSLFRQLYATNASKMGLNLVEDANGNQLFTVADLTTEVESYNTVSSNYKNIKKNFFDNSFNSKINNESFMRSANGVLSTPNGNVNFKTLLQQRGIIDAQGNKLKNITDDAMVKNIIKANASLSAVGNYVKTFNLSDSTLNVLGEIFKENVSALKNAHYYDTNNDRVDVSKNMELYKRVAPKIYNFLNNYNKESGVFNNNVANLTNVLPYRQESLSKTEKEAYLQNLASNLKGVGVDNAILMTNPKNEVFQKFAQQIVGFGNVTYDGDKTYNMGGATVDDIKEIAYRIKQSNGEMSVNFKLNTKDGVIPMQAKVSVSDLKRNSPDFMNSLEFQEKDFYYSNKGLGNKAVSTSSDGITYVNPNANAVYNYKLQSNLQGEFGSLPEYGAVIAGVNKDDSKRFLANEFDYKTNKIFYQDIISDTALSLDEKKQAIKLRQQTYLGAVNNIVDNSSNYILDAKFINDNNYVLQLKDKQGRTVASVVEQGDNLREIKKLFDNYESSAYNVFMNRLIQKEKLNFVNGSVGFTEPFKKITGLQ